MKILWYMNGPSPYRINFLNLLSKQSDLFVLIDSIKIQKRNEKYYGKNIKFNNKILKKIDLLNIKKYSKGDYDFTIIQHYFSINALLLMLFLKINKKKYIINVDGGILNNKEFIFFYLIKRMIISSADYWITSSQYNVDYLLNYGADSKKIFKYHFASVYDKDCKFKIKKQQISDKYEIIFDKPTFVSVGTFEHRKGFDLLLRAINNYHIDNANFVLIGGGEKKNEYLSFIKNNNLENVIIIDFVEKNELLKILNCCDCFIFPSRFDIWGLVIAEAMSQGLPVISSNMVGASLEILDRNFIFDVNDLESIYGKVKMILKMTEEERKKIGNDNRNKSLLYTYENMVKDHLDIFNNLK